MSVEERPPGAPAAPAGAPIDLPPAAPAQRIAHDLRGVIGTLKLALALLERSPEDATTRQLAQGILGHQLDLLHALARDVESLG